MITIAEYLNNRDEFVCSYTDDFCAGVSEQMARQIFDFDDRRQRLQVRQQEAYAANVNLQMTI